MKAIIKLALYQLRRFYWSRTQRTTSKHKKNPTQIPKPSHFLPGHRSTEKSWDKLLFFFCPSHWM